MLKTTTRTNTYGIAGNITLDKLSNCLAFKNAGNSICVFDSDPLQPGESKVIAGWPHEVITGRYSFFFQTPAVVPVGYVQDDMAVVTEQYYLPDQNLSR